MSKFSKFSLAISCFLPLFPIFFLENLYTLFSFFLKRESGRFCQSTLGQSMCVYFNVVLMIVWVLLIVAGAIGICRFQKNFLKATKCPKEKVVLTKADNITADCYFTYFAFFIVSFFNVDPTSCKDVLIFFAIMILVVWVYVANEMYFVNPVLSMCGYKSFSIKYYKYYENDLTSKDLKRENVRILEAKVLAKEPLERWAGKDSSVYLAFSQYDFTVCISPKWEAFR